MILGVGLLVAGLVPIGVVAGVRAWRNATPGERKSVVTMIAAVVCLFAVLAGISMIATGGK